MLRYFPITGRLVMTDDPAGTHVILDTDEDMLCVKPADVETGSIVVPARTASSTGVDGTRTVVDTQVDYYIATLDIPGANIVRGMMRVTWASNPEPADNLWRQASGTHLDILDGVQFTTKPQSDTAGYDRVATLGGYTFYVNALGHLILRERIVMRARDPGNPGTSFNRARQQATVSFRLLVGFFLNSDFTQKAGLEYVGGSYQVYLTSISLSQANVPLGYSFPGRRLVFLVTSYSNLGTATRTLTGLTVNGNGVTIHDSVQGTGGSNNNAIAIASIGYEGPTRGTVNLSFNSNPTRAYLEIYLWRSRTGNAPTVSKSEGTGTRSVNISRAADAAALIMSASRSAGGITTSSNVTVDNAGSLNETVVGKPNTGPGTSTLSATPVQSVSSALLGAVFT